MNTTNINTRNPEFLYINKPQTAKSVKRHSNRTRYYAAKMND